MRWFIPRTNNNLALVLFLCAITIATLGVWSFSEHGQAQKLQSQLELVEKQIERNPLIAPPSTLKISDFSMTGEWLMIRLGKNAKLFTVNGTSMLPIVSDGGKLIGIPVANIADIEKGSFIITTPLDPSISIGHQIIEIGTDDQGWYAQTKGTGNFERDFWKVRIGDIKYRVVLVIY